MRAMYPPGPPGAPQAPPPQPYPGQAQPGIPVSPDGRFVWNGYSWVPYQKPSNVGVVVAVVGVAFLVALPVIVIVILTVVGKQVNNVFSNVSGPFTPLATP